jgi:hypothetical protein
LFLIDLIAMTVQQSNLNGGSKKKYTA